nr:immunoglobulin light chain junction region [Macaca mulatta]MOV76984.1 immunoglobulin light chain junction region [Macaca mulatta]MOV77520.1 immunoglobulin light chain junction region [Macaca mulatta]
CQGYISAPFTF